MKKATLTAIIATTTMLVACGQQRFDSSYESPEPSVTPTVNQYSLKQKHEKCSNRNHTDANTVRYETISASSFDNDIVYYNPMLKKDIHNIDSIIMDKRDYGNFLYALYMNSKNVIKVSKHPKKQGFLIIEFQICNN